jgi:DNA-binding MarR family transcriptional regulator
VPGGENEPALSSRLLAVSRPEPRLGYLLKQAHRQFMELTTTALAPLGVDTREWAALICLADERGLSQGEVAVLLGVDRTTMVALVDDLQRKRLVRREPHPEDRRKKQLELTVDGRDVLQQGALLVDDAERRFLAALSQQDAQHLKSTLKAVIASGP